MRKFHLSDVLTVTTGRLVSTRHMEGVYDILNYMTGESLFTHQLPRASKICGVAILCQHPELANIKYDHVNPENCRQWLSDQLAKFPNDLEIYPLVAGDYEAKDPITEWLEMRSKPTEDE